MSLFLFDFSDLYIIYTYSSTHWSNYMATTTVEWRWLSFWLFVKTYITVIDWAFAVINSQPIIK